MYFDSMTILFINMTFRLGLAIPDGAIEEMQARVKVTDEDLKVAAAEGESASNILFHRPTLFIGVKLIVILSFIEKIRRHDVMARKLSCTLSLKTET